MFEYPLLFVNSIYSDRYLILIGRFRCTKEAKLMDLILDKCIFQNRFLCFQSDMLLIHIGIVS